MNGEFVDWADAKVHVGVHGLHYGTGVFEGIRCYETPDGPAVFRLREHLQRLENSAKLLYMELPFTVEELRTAIHELVGRNGLAECYLRPFAFYGYGELGVQHEGQSRRRRGHELAVGQLPRRRERRHGHPLQDLVLEADRREHDPARRQGDRHLPQLDARGARGAERRLRRGDPAHRRRLRRRRLGREHLRRQGRQDLDAAALHLDPARDHARQRDPDRAGPRLRRRGGEHDPLRPLSRRRDLHDGHRRRGDAGPLGRRPRDRRRPGHARAAEGVPRHRARQVATAGATGSTASRWATRLPPRREGGRRGRFRSRRRTSTSATRSSCSRCCARGASRSGRRSTASRSSSPRRSERRTRPPSPRARRACTCSP